MRVTLRGGVDPAAALLAVATAFQGATSMKVRCVVRPGSAPGRLLVLEAWARQLSAWICTAWQAP